MAERFASMSLEQLEFERAKNYHDGWIEPDWRGRGAAPDVASRPLPPGQFDPADAKAPANPEPRPPLDSPTNFDGEAVEPDLTYHSTISVDLERIILAAEATPEKCESEGKFYREGPGKPTCVSKPGETKDEPSVEESGVFGEEDPDEILGLAKDDPRQYDADDDPFAAKTEFEPEQFAASNLGEIYTVEEADKAINQALKHGKELVEKTQQAKKAGNKDAVLQLEKEQEEHKEYLKKLKSRRARIKQSGKREMEAIHDIGEKLYEPPPEPEKFQEWVEKLNEKMEPLTNFIEAALEKGGLGSPGTFGQLIGSAPSIAKTAIGIAGLPFKGAEKIIADRIKKSMPDAYRDLALKRAGEIAAKRAKEQSKAVEREAQALYKKVSKIKPDIAATIKGAKSLDDLDAVLEDIDAWSEQAATAEEAQQALDAKELVSKLQRVKRLRQVQDAPERYIPPRVKESLLSDPEQYLKNDRGLTSKMVAEAVGRSITKALGG